MLTAIKGYHVPNESVDRDMVSRIHDLDKRLTLVESKIETVAELKKAADDLQKAVNNLNTEYEKMKAYSKGKNRVVGLWCAATGVVCTGLFMLGQILLQNL